MIITHDALNLIVQGSPLPALALYRDPTHPLVAKRVISILLECLLLTSVNGILRVGEPTCDLTKVLKKAA